jgi:hypothetical protein
LLCSTAYQKILYLSRERERERESVWQREAAYETDGIEAAPTWLLQIWVFYFLFLIYLGFVELSVYVFTFLFYITLLFISFYHNVRAYVLLTFLTFFFFFFFYVISG